MWEFSIGLILLELCPDSLALVALFGLIDSIAQVIAGPHIGAYVDRHAFLPCLSSISLSSCVPFQHVSKGFSKYVFKSKDLPTRRPSQLIALSQGLSTVGMG